MNLGHPIIREYTIINKDRSIEKIKISTIKINIRLSFGFV